jgi:hypothetical protein
MTFGAALELCTRGKRIYRTGWNGKDQFVYYQDGSVVYTANLRCDSIKEWARKKGFTTVYIMGHFDIKTTAGGIQCGWFATQGDMIAMDWEVYDD